MSTSPGQSLRRSLMLAALVAAGSVGVVACREKKSSAFDAGVVALVNGEILSRAEFEKVLLRDLQGIEPVEQRTPEQVEPFRRAQLESLVERALLLQEANKLNLRVTPEEIDRRVLQLSADYPAEGFDSALSQGRMSMAELKRNTAALLTIEKLFDAHVYTRVAVTEEEIRGYYDSHEAEYQQPEEVRAQQVVVRSLDEARKLQQLLRQGRKFSDLARKYSLSADAKVGGDLGFFRRGTMPAAFDEVAFKLAVGQVSDVVTTDYGFHLFKVLERQPTQKRELAEVRGQVEKKLLEHKRVEAQRDFVAKLKEKAQITVNEAVLQSITGRTGPEQPPAAR